MSNNLSLPVSMKSFKRLLTIISPDTTICVRGRHAIGKSEGVYQGAAERRSDFYKDPVNCCSLMKSLGSLRHPEYKTPVTEWNYELGMPIIERRLSQMTEGDIIGLPVLDQNSTSTQFKPCDWLIQACEFPVVLFLDERNRALEGVKQAVFQLADSKVFYGHRLHAETIIVIAENVGSEYTINQSDPAEISRAATVTLEPDENEWLDYVKTRCNSVAVDFWRQNKNLIEHTGAYEPNKKYPDRRSWFKLDQELTRLELYDDPSDHMFYVLTGAFVGAEIAQSFKKFCLESDKNVSAADILRNWTKSKTRIERGGTISNETYIELVSKIGAHLEKHQLTNAEAIECARFMHDAPAEARTGIFSILQKDLKNLLKVHGHVSELIVRTFTAQDTTVCIPPTSEDTREKPTGTTEQSASPSKKKKRGVRK